jgi:hypothetical protein
LIKRAIIAATTALLFGASAHAAKVNPTSGSLFIDRGTGYQEVNQPTDGKTGDVVIALVGGSGEVVFPDGCRVKVEVGSVVTITEPSPCAALNNNTTAGGVDTTLIIGGVAVAGGVAAAIALSGGNDKPASP